MRVPRTAVALLGVLVLPVLVACSSASSPLCAQASKLAEEHHLTEALSRYRDAERAGEGGCATDGQRDVAETQSAVALVLADAASAERRQELKQAGDLYVQALTQDVDNQQARAAIARLQALAEPAPSTSATPTAGARASASEDSGPDPVFVLLVTVVLLIALATGIIAALARQRDRPRFAGPTGVSWLGPGDATSRRIERLESQVGFLLGAVDELASSSPVPRVRTDVVPPRPAPDGERTTTVTGVTVVRLPDAETLLVAVRRIVHETGRPGDELLADIARLGTGDAPHLGMHLGMLLEEAGIVAATKGTLDTTWRVVEEAWQVAGDTAADAVGGQVRELIAGRPVVLPADATDLPDPLVALARQVAGQVETPGDEVGDGAHVLVQATGIAARPLHEAGILLTAVVRSLRYDLPADTVAAALRDTVPDDHGPDAEGPAASTGPGGGTGADADTVGAPPESASRSGGLAGRPVRVGTGGGAHAVSADDLLTHRPVERSADPPSGGVAHLFDPPRRPGPPPRST